MREKYRGFSLTVFVCHFHPSIHCHICNRARALLSLSLSPWIFAISTKLKKKKTFLLYRVIVDSIHTAAVPILCVQMNDQANIECEAAAAAMWTAIASSTTTTSLSSSTSTKIAITTFVIHMKITLSKITTQKPQRVFYSNSVQIFRAKSTANKQTAIS